MSEERKGHEAAAEQELQSEEIRLDELMEKMKAFQASLHQVQQDTVRAFARKRIKIADELEQQLLFDCQQISIMVEGVRARIAENLSGPQSIDNCLRDSVDHYLCSFAPQIEKFQA